MTTKAALLFFLFALGPLGSGSLRAAEVAPGRYQNWNGQIAEVTVARVFNADDYRDILVEPLGTVGVDVPEEPRKKEAALALKSAKAAFMDGLRGNLRERRPNRSTKRGRVDDALVIRAHLVAIDPGSENARYYLFGLGKGAVSVSLEGEILERSSHRILLTFRQTRHSAAGPGGGTGFGELFSKITRQIGGDVATLINAF